MYTPSLCSAIASAYLLPRHVCVREDHALFGHAEARALALHGPLAARPHAEEEGEEVGVQLRRLDLALRLDAHHRGAALLHHAVHLGQEAKNSDAVKPSRKLRHALKQRSKP